MGGLRARGVSLWLMPEEEALDRLAGLVGRLAERLSTVAFAPHVTLLPGIEAWDEARVLETCARLAATLPPLPVRFLGLDGEDGPFRCLFARAAGDGLLRAAHAAAAGAFGREPDPAFLPHLSLVYGTLPAAIKRELVAELAGEIGGGFEATALHAWRTEGAVGEWREIGAFPFDRPRERR